MTIIGIGIDVVEIDRIKSSWDEFGERFLDRIFTSNEREYSLKQKRPEIHLAARFAAKEAVAKAFGTGIGKDVGWLDMEITRRETGEPIITLIGQAKEFANVRGVAEVKISLTHAKHYAAANALILG